MFDDVLIESAGRDRKKGGWITALISTVIHLAVVGAVITAGYYVKENPDVMEKPMAAFVVAAAPPPPPPPPPASGGGATRARTVDVPRETRPQELRQPADVPRDVPAVAEVPSTGEAAEDGGVPGGVPGGVRGGVVGGVPGGELGGVVGGELGGVPGGEIGGTGDAPVRVGGNVKAPTIISQTQPLYTEFARKARIQGLVVVEAVIDRHGNVTEARVLKPLPMGLDQQALAAIKQWKFRPGTMNGQPVPVYFTLTVHFQLH